MTDIDRIRALAQGIIGEATRMTNEVGEAGSHEERTRAEVAKRVLFELEVVTTEIGDGRSHKTCRCAFCGYTAVCLPTDDFYSDRTPGSPLACETCMLAGKVSTPITKVRM